MPEHYLRYLGKLLGQLPIVRRDSLAIRIYYVEECPVILSSTTRFHYGALSSSSPPRAHDVSVVDTSLIYCGYISNLRPAVSWKSNCAFASRYFNKFLPLRMISGGVKIWSLLGIDCAAAPHS